MNASLPSWIWALRMILSFFLWAMVPPKISPINQITAMSPNIAWKILKFKFSKSKTPMRKKMTPPAANILWRRNHWSGLCLNTIKTESKKNANPITMSQKCGKLRIAIIQNHSSSGNLMVKDSRFLFKYCSNKYKIKTQQGPRVLEDNKKSLVIHGVKYWLGL